MIIGLGVDFWIHFVGWVFVLFALVSVSFLDFWRVLGSVLPVFLLYSAGMFTGKNTGMSWSRCVGGEVLLPLGYDVREERENKNFQATKLGVRLGVAGC